MTEKLPAPVPGRRIRCVVVQGQTLVLQMLCGSLRALSSVEVVATGTSLRDVGRLEATRAIDLLILDPELGDGSGFELLRSLVSMHPALRCLLITNSAAPAACPPDLAKWIVASVSKDDPLNALLSAIERELGVPVALPMQAASMEHVRARLTPRETDVFVQIGRGMSNKEIARSLGLSVQTVATHRKSISKKLDCNGASLVRLATLAGHVSAS